MGKKLTTPAEKRWLLNTTNGRILPWTPILAVRLDTVDCTAEGEPIDRRTITRDDPYIQQETKAVAERLRAGGGDEATVADFGRHLTELFERKSTALRHDGSKREALEHKTVVVEENPLSPRIQAMVDAAHNEIHDMALDAYWRIAGKHRPRRYRYSEVAYVFQRKQAMEAILA